MTKFLVTASALLMLGVPAMATPVKPVKSASLVCPVTGDKIASVKAAVGHSTYKGKTYYFCCSSCKPQFDKDPAKYAKTASATVTEKPTATPKM